MNLKKISDSIVFNSLKNISYGNIKFINYDGSVINLGSETSDKTATLKLKKPGLTFEIINKGSIGLAEAYMRGDFETDNLTNLIEIAAKNINKVDGVVALGCVIKGKTPHFEFISAASTNAIMQISLQYKKPIGNGILTCLNKSQAIKRVSKGSDAAKAVVSILTQK